jgi:hypothetical protein
MLFEVKAPPPASIGPLAAMIAKLEAETDSLVEGEASSPNSRMISPWMLTTRWHEHIQGFEVAELKSLIALPKEPALQGLHALMRRYMEKATDLLQSTSELALQRLNTADPAKE